MFEKGRIDSSVWARHLLLMIALNLSDLRKDAFFEVVPFCRVQIPLFAARCFGDCGGGTDWRWRCLWPGRRVPLYKMKLEVGLVSSCFNKSGSSNLHSYCKMHQKSEPVQKNQWHRIIKDAWFLAGTPPWSHGSSSVHLCSRRFSRTKQRLKLWIPGF